MNIEAHPLRPFGPPLPQAGEEKAAAAVLPPLAGEVAAKRSMGVFL